jgi:hypothetical protein
MKVLNTTSTEIKEYLTKHEVFNPARINLLSTPTLAIMATEWGMFEGTSCESYDEVYVDGVDITEYFN